MGGLWIDIKPNKIALKHEWVFAYYYEYPSDRADARWYGAFLFRNSDHRTIFGIREYWDDLPHQNDLRHLATRVVIDDDLRQSLISENPDLPKWWKRH
ncbi:MAG: hypothetical protein JWQ71_1469 [Pedosphaera sp.]|nr:hypothetical protein [Pedosphaera sp.]